MSSTDALLTGVYVVDVCGTVAVVVWVLVRLYQAITRENSE